MISEEVCCMPLVRKNADFVIDYVLNADRTVELRLSTVGGESVLYYATYTRILEVSRGSDWRAVLSSFLNALLKRKGERGIVLSGCDFNEDGFLGIKAKLQDRGIDFGFDIDGRYFFIGQVIER